MKTWPFDSSKNKSPRIGRISPMDVEINDPVADWYYFGKVEMFETEADLANKKQKIYFYRLLTRHTEDEKVIVSTDDFVQNANQVPYTRSDRGKTRLMQIIMLAYVAIELLTLYLSYLFVQAGPSIQYYPQVTSNLEWNFGTVAFLFVAVAITWAWSARYHHFVLDWEIQPLIVNAEKANVDFYILTNSARIPVVERVKILMGLSSKDVEELVHQVRLFQDKVIKDLTDQNAAMTKRMNEIDIEGLAIGKKSLELSLATREQRMVERLDTLKWIGMTAVVAVAFAFVVYIGMGGRL